MEDQNIGYNIHVGFDDALFNEKIFHRLINSFIAMVDCLQNHRSQCIPMSRNNCTDGDSKECPNKHPMPKFLYNLNPDQVAGWSFLFIQIY